MSIAVPIKVARDQINRLRNCRITRAIQDKVSMRCESSAEAPPWDRGSLTNQAPQTQGVFPGFAPSRRSSGAWNR